MYTHTRTHTCPPFLRTSGGPKALTSKPDLGGKKNASTFPKYPQSGVSVLVAGLTKQRKSRWPPRYVFLSVNPSHTRLHIALFVLLEASLVEASPPPPPSSSFSFQGFVTLILHIIHWLVQLYNYIYRNVFLFYNNANNYGMKALLRVYWSVERASWSITWYHGSESRITYFQQGKEKRSKSNF